MSKHFFYLFLVCALFGVIHALVIGVDLGSDNFKIFIVRPRGIEIVENIDSGRKTFTALSFSSDIRSFGEQVSIIYTKSPDRVFNGLMNFMGLSFNATNDDHIQWVSKICQDNSIFYFQSLKFPSEMGEPLMVQVNNDRMFVEELFAHILSKAVEYSSKAAKSHVFDASLTVPSHWTQSQRQSLLNSASIAGVNVLSLINHNTAIAIKYAFDFDEFERPKLVLFYDMGAFHSRVSIYKFEKISRKSKSNALITKVTLIGQVWDDQLGGSSFDKAIVQHWVKEIEGKFGSNVSGGLSSSAMAKLIHHAKKAKEVLSTNKEAHIFVEYLLPDYDFSTTLKRQDFEQICAPLFDRVSQLVKRALEKTGLVQSDLSYVELFGGGLRIPKVQMVIKSALEPLELSRHLNFDESAAFGTAIYAATHSLQHRVKTIDVEDSSKTVYPILYQPWNASTFPLTNTPFDPEHRQVLSLIHSRNFADASALLDKMQPSSATFFLNGVLQLLLRNYESAILQFNKNLKSDPGNVYSWTNLAICHLELKNSQLALSSLKNALELHPKFLPALHAKIALLLSQNNLNESKILLSSANTHNSPLGAYLNGLAFLLEKNDAMAIRAFNRALTLNERYGEAMHALCSIHQSHSTNPNSNDTLNCRDISADVFYWNNHSVALPSPDWDDGVDILFDGDTSFPSRRIFNFLTSDDIFVALKYPELEDFHLKCIPTKIMNVAAMWPENLTKNFTETPLVTLQFELNSNGIVELSKAFASVKYNITEYVKKARQNSTQSHSNATADKNDVPESSDLNNTETITAQNVTKIKYVRLNVVQSSETGLNENHIQEAKNRLQEIERAEKRIREMESIKSDLESLIYDTYEKLDDLYLKYSTEEERISIKNLIDKEGEWIESIMNDDDNSITKDDYLDHHRNIIEKLRPITLRISEPIDFPKAVAECLAFVEKSLSNLQMINLTRNVSENEYLEVEKELNNTRQFVLDSSVSESTRAPHQDPRITSKQLLQKCHENKWRLDILKTHPRRTFPPPTSNTPPPPKSSSTNDSSSSNPHTTFSSSSPTHNTNVSQEDEL